MGLRCLFLPAGWQLRASKGYEPRPTRVSAQSSVLHKYLICMFKGLNIISAQNYEIVPPQTWAETICLIIGTYLQIVIASYVLGTIINYLVKKDERAEMFHKQLIALEEYCTQRDLPDSLCKRLRSYYEFQQHKTKDDDLQARWPRRMRLPAPRRRWSTHPALWGACLPCLSPCGGRR